MPPILQLPAHILDLARACALAEGRLWVVGGSVRDVLLQRPSHDHDLEVHGLSRRTLERLLRKLGPTREVGLHFPVYKVKVGEEILDVSLPLERRTGEASRGSSTVDPEGSLREAARRRDLTINAMAYDPLEDRIADPYGGVEDVEKGVLRAVDPETFVEDPLRAFRVGRFYATLGLKPEPELTALCRTLPVSELPPERVQIELERMLLESPGPGQAVTWLREGGLLAAVHPRLAQAGARPEALDRAASVREHAGEVPRQAALMWTCLLGPPSAGVTELFETLRVGRRQGYPLGPTVVRLLAQGLELPRPCTDTHLRQVADQVEAGLWCLTTWAWGGEEAARDAWLRTHALGVAREPLPPLLTGRELLASGVPHGQAIGRLLAAVREAQLEGRLEQASEAHAFAMRLWSSANPSSND